MHCGTYRISKISFHLLPEQDDRRDRYSCGMHRQYQLLLYHNRSRLSLPSHPPWTANWAISGALVSPQISNMLLGKGENLQAFRLLGWFQIQSLDAAQVPSEDFHIVLHELFCTPHHQISLAASQDSIVDFWNSLTNKEEDRHKNIIFLVISCFSCNGLLEDQRPADDRAVKYYQGPLTPPPFLALH